MLLKEAFFLQRGDTGARVTFQLHGLSSRTPWFIRGAYTAASSAEVKGLGRQTTASWGEDLVWAGQGFWRLEAQTLLLRRTTTQNQGQLGLLRAELLTHSPGLRLTEGEKEKQRRNGELI